MILQRNISVADYQKIRNAVGWIAITDEQAEASLRNSEYVVSCVADGQTVGTARVMYDGGYVAFIVDVIVLPEYQRQGVGRMMMNSIMDHLHSLVKDGEKMLVNLYASQGKEPFYWKHGFLLGSGMFQWI